MFPTAVLQTPGLTARVLVGLLLAFYVLLPLDRGFPTVPLFGRPLNSAIAATLAVLLVLIVRSRGTVLAHLREPYCVLQTLYACTLVVGALRAPSPLSALHWTLLYYSTFVLNYIILRHVTRSYGAHWITITVVGLGVAAAAVGIVQGVLGIPLPMYDAWYENYFRTPPEDYALATARAAGPMNNPILYCVLMALTIPYALELPDRRVRAVALFIIMFAAGLSGSRTGVFVVAAVAAAAVAVYRWRAVRALPAVGLGLVLLLAALTWLGPGGEGSRLGFLVERLGLLADRSTVAQRSRPVLNSEAATGSRTAGIEAANRLDADERAEVSAALGVSLREGAVRETAREMLQEWGPLTWMVGRGSLTSPMVGMRIQPWYTTVDNVFLCVLYERGLSGLALFASAFLAFLFTTRRAATTSVHWYAPVTLAVTGLSFCWDAYSMFNILAVGSMAVAALQHEEWSAPATSVSSLRQTAVPRIAVLTNVLPSYRQGFYDRLFARADLVTTVYCQPAIAGINVRSIHARYPGRVRLVQGIAARGEAIGWQFTPWRSVLFDYDVVVVDGNPRSLSRALTATVLRLLRRTVVLWTAGHSYGANPLTERARLWWTRMFDRLLVYTDAEVRYLRDKGFATQDIIALNNGLDQVQIDAATTGWSAPRLDEWRRQQNLSGRTVLLSCARLDPKNRFEQMVTAMPKILRQVPNAIWCVIGSGTEEARLVSQVRDAGLSDRVRFVGELYEEIDLAPWFLSAAVFVHPAAIGLSILHAFGYGLPVVTHSTAEHHGPEFTAFTEGLSGRTYREHDIAGLASAVIGLVQDQAARSVMARHVRHVARAEYNVDVMVERFVTAVRNALGHRRPSGARLL
jgi:glycosyltransferase involved in cell wall biosynthesis